MIKVFTLNKNGKIELTKKQLENLLNEAYYQGKGYNYTTTWTYTTPTPYYTITNDNITCTTTDTSNLTASNLTYANTGTAIKADDIKYRS